MKLPRPRLSYANVVATLALLLAIGGGAAYAAGKIHSGDIAKGAVRTANLHSRAITSGKLAIGAVRGNQVAPGALGSAQLGDGSIKPSNLQVPVQVVAEASGGAFAVPTSGTADYPLDLRWTQPAGQVEIVAGEVAASLRYGGGAPPFCQPVVALSLDGQTLGFATPSTGSTSLVQVADRFEVPGLIGPGTGTAHALTARVESNGNCAADSSIESLRVEVVGIG